MHYISTVSGIDEKAYDGEFDVYDEEFEFGPDDYDRLIEMLPTNSRCSLKDEKSYFDKEVSKNGPMRLRIKRGSFSDSQEPKLVSYSKSGNAPSKSDKDPVERDMNSAMTKNPEALKVVIDLILNSED